MARVLCLVLGVFLCSLGDPQVEGKQEANMRCFLRCKFGLQGGSLAGKDEISRRSQLPCGCINKNAKRREKRSPNEAGNGTTTGDVAKNIINNQIKERKDHGISECYKYIKRKKEEINVTQHKADTGSVNLQSINVTFIKRGDWLAYVTWDPPNEKLNFLEKYLILFSAGNEKFKTYCQELPRNQTFKVLNSSHGRWKYPYGLHIAVVALPYRRFLTDSIGMGSFTPTVIPEVLPFGSVEHFNLNKRKNKDDKTTLYLIIFAIALSFFILAAVAFACFVHRKRKRTPLIEECETIQVQASKPQNNDVYFASYLPESEKFSDEVATIAYKLGMMGYKVLFDQVDSVHMNEIGFNMWVDKQIIQAKKYIVFCSPGYVKLWQSLATSVVKEFNYVNEQDLVRVRYEIKRISDVYSENCSTSRIVCIKMDPKMTTKQLPPWMNHNMLLWPEQREDVIRRLNDQAAMVMHM